MLNFHLICSTLKTFVRTFKINRLEIVKETTNTVKKSSGKMNVSLHVLIRLLNTYGVFFSIKKCAFY